MLDSLKKEDRDNKCLQNDIIYNLMCLGYVYKKHTLQVINISTVDFIFMGI